jgi:hypothetical protein
MNIKYERVIWDLQSNINFNPINIIHDPIKRGYNGVPLKQGLTVSRKDKKSVIDNSSSARNWRLVCGVRKEAENRKQHTLKYYL